MTTNTWTEDGVDRLIQLPLIKIQLLIIILIILILISRIKNKPYLVRKRKESRDIADKSGKKSNTCAYYEIYLSEYYGKPIEIKHIIAGVNRSNGYPYLVFGYIEKENNVPALNQ